MAINPNTNFTGGQVLTSDNANRWPRGIMAAASSQATYALTTATTISAGMSVTFTAVANRYYKITYYEPQMQTSNVASSFSQLELRQTNAAGTFIASTLFFTLVANQNQVGISLIKLMTFSAGSITLVGCSKTSSTAGAPVLVRDAQREALLLVEDVGPA